MPSTPHVLDEARDLVKKRLSELDDERKRSSALLPSWAGRVTASAAGRRPVAKRRPGRPRGSGQAKRRPLAGRRKGTRADQAVALVRNKPGISASEIAKTMKIKPNYLYRVLGDLEKEKRVKKKGRQYYPARIARRGRPALGLDQAEPADRVALLAQLGGAGIDPLAREVGHLEPLDDPPLAARAGARVGRRRSPPRSRRSRRRERPSRPSPRPACRAPSRGRGRWRRSQPRRRSRRRGPR